MLVAACSWEQEQVAENLQRDLQSWHSARTRFHFSQEELAERADLHRNYVGGVERGERNIGLEKIMKLAKALSVRAADLFEQMP